MTSGRLLASSEDEYTRLEMSLAIPNASMTLSSEANSSEHLMSVLAFKKRRPQNLFKAIVLRDSSSLSSVIHHSVRRSSLPCFYIPILQLVISPHIAALKVLAESVEIWKHRGRIHPK
jgi:hypothetical protein